MATIIFIFSQPVEDTEPGISEVILNMFAQTQKNQKQKQQQKKICTGLKSCYLHIVTWTE